MSASKYDFIIEQGASFRLSLIYKDDNNNPVDLTDWCARLVWKTNKNSNQVFITTNLDYSLYKFTIEPSLGKLTLLMPPDTTNNFNFQTAQYDLELQTDDNIYVGGDKNIIRLLYGTVTVVPRFSKTTELLECD